LPLTRVAQINYQAKILAEKAYTVRRLLSGSDNPVTVAMKRLAERPVEHHLYGARMKCYDDIWEPPQGLDGEELENWLWNTDGWAKYSF